MYGGRLRSAVWIPLRRWACKRQTHYWLPAGTPSVRQKYRPYHEHRRGLCHRCRSHTRILALPSSRRKGVLSNTDFLGGSCTGVAVTAGQAPIPSPVCPAGTNGRKGGAREDAGPPVGASLISSQEVRFRNCLSRVGSSAMRTPLFG